MLTKTIAFTGIKTAELIDTEVKQVEGNLVKVKMEYTVISGGTEKANLLGMNNTSKIFPKFLGYCGVGFVTEIGDKVQSVSVGDRVLVYHGIHTQYNVVPENDVTKVEYDNVDSLDAAFVVIASMGLGGVRKLEVELGESAMVIGLGLLGIFSVQFLRLSGAYPVIAVDIDAKRRELALKLGADFAFDPLDVDFAKKVKEVTKDKGVNATVEVTGAATAMKTALECASYMGRISLLGCTRVSDCAIDYYSQVHTPGIKIIGAHNFVRPKVESYPHHWTHQDDCKAILGLLAANRIAVRPIVSRVVSPEQAPQIYTELCESKEFPMGTVFDWRNI